MPSVAEDLPTSDGKYLENFSDKKRAKPLRFLTNCAII